jgi:5-methylcytosine-specific restriction protein A
MPKDSFYNSKAWKWLRRVKLTTDPLCEVCKVQGRLVRAMDVDHEVGIHEDPSLRLNMENLVSMCHPCHSRKTLFVERMGTDRVPIKGCTADGLPLDPEHPWNEKKLGTSEDKDRARTFPRSKF